MISPAVLLLMFAGLVAFSNGVFALANALYPTSGEANAEKQQSLSRASLLILSGYITTVIASIYGWGAFHHIPGAFVLTMPLTAATLIWAKRLRSKQTASEIKCGLWVAIAAVCCLLLLLLLPDG